MQVKIEYAIEYKRSDRKRFTRSLGSGFADKEDALRFVKDLIKNFGDYPNIVAVRIVERTSKVIKVYKKKNEM